jgi:hypothetical protein
MKRVTIIAVSGIFLCGALKVREGYVVVAGEIGFPTSSEFCVDLEGCTAGKDSHY